MQTAQLLKIAEEKKSKGRYQEALEVYRELISIDPQKSSYFYKAGLCLMQLSKYSKALELFTRASELWGQSGWYRYRKAQCLFNMSLTTQCRFELKEIWEEFCQNLPDENKLLRKNIVNLYRKCFEREGKIELAIKAAKKAVEIDPDDVFTHYNLGKLLQTSQNYSEAEQAFRKAMEIDKTKDYIMDHLGKILFLSGKTKEAISTMSALPSSQRQWYYHLHFASLLFKCGHLKYSLWECSVSIFKKKKDNPNAYFLLANILLKMNHISNAIWALEKAAADMMEMHHVEFSDAMDLLSELKENFPELKGEIPELKLKGTIELFNEKKGFGFIKGSNDRFFFHKSALKGFHVASGDNVLFLPSLGRKGGEASFIKKINP